MIIVSVESAKYGVFFVEFIIGYFQILKVNDGFVTEVYF